jgi:hypothetical protein
LDSVFQCDTNKDVARKERQFQDRFGSVLPLATTTVERQIKVDLTLHEVLGDFLLMPWRGIGGKPTARHIAGTGQLFASVITAEHALSNFIHSFALLTWVGYPLRVSKQVLTFFVAHAGPN